jgi:ribosomal protein S18 acetylase RimI-like enzyme
VHRTAGPPARAAISVRLATDADLAAMVRIEDAVFPEYPETAEEIQAFEARLRGGGYTSVRAVAVTLAGDAVGYSHFRHIPDQFDPGRYHVSVFTHPNWQRRGVGSALFDHMLGALAARGARAIESFARESMPEAIAFLQHRGFRETLRTWEVRLDLARFDPVPFAGYLERARDAGVVITTLAEEHQRDPEALRRAYELRKAIMAEIPAPVPFTPPPFEHYLRSTLESPRALPEAYFIAKVGDRHVGEANLQRPAGGRALYHDVTGVLPAYRGHGVAVALKLATIAYGQAHGYAEIWTWNDAGNAGMLAINDRLGFARQPAWITFEKGLVPATR